MAALSVVNVNAPGRASSKFMVVPPAGAANDAVLPVWVMIVAADNGQPSATAADAARSRKLSMVRPILPPIADETVHMQPVALDGAVIIRCNHNALT